MSNIFKRSIIISALLTSTLLIAQVEKEKDSIPLSERYIVFEGDTLLIELDEILLLKKLDSLWIRFLKLCSWKYYIVRVKKRKK